MNWDIIGHENIIATLTTDLAQNKYPHAYLFIGPSEIGKKRVAIQLAQSLNCQDENTIPCLKCPQCKRINKELHSDVQIIKAAEVKKNISISQIRELDKSIMLQPFEGKKRVIIIDQVEKMNAQSQNAFLKTLEEPPSNVVFVLITDKATTLLPTVRSRCKELFFHRLPTDQLESAIKKSFQLPTEKAYLISRLSQGRPGKAIIMASQKESLDKRNANIITLRGMPKKKIMDRFRLANELAEQFKNNRHSISEILDLWTCWWRDVLMVKLGENQCIDNPDQEKLLIEDASYYSKKSIVDFLNTICSTIQQLEDNVNPRLALEVLMLKQPNKE